MLGGGRGPTSKKIVVSKIKTHLRKKTWKNWRGGGIWRTAFRNNQIVLPEGGEAGPLWGGRREVSRKREPPGPV